MHRAYRDQQCRGQRRDSGQTHRVLPKPDATPVTWRANYGVSSPINQWACAVSLDTLNALRDLLLPPSRRHFSPKWRGLAGDRRAELQCPIGLERLHLGDRSVAGGSIRDIGPSVSVREIRSLATALQFFPKRSPAGGPSLVRRQTGSGV